jgi:ADP-ribose pyrophosphatase
MEVREDQVVRPDGKDGIYGVVEMKNGASVLPMDDENNVYLTKEFRYALGEESIEAAGGVVDDGEDGIQAAKRELKEELGIVADEWVDLGRLEPFTGAVHSSANLYLARGLKFGSTKAEGTEIISVVKITLNEAVEMVMNSEIVHGQTSVLILKAARYLGKL